MGKGKPKLSMRHACDTIPRRIGSKSIQESCLAPATKYVSLRKRRVNSVTCGIGRRMGHVLFYPLPIKNKFITASSCSIVRFCYSPSRRNYRKHFLIPNVSGTDDSIFPKGDPNREEIVPFVWRETKHGSGIVSDKAFKLHRTPN